MQKPGFGLRESGYRACAHRISGNIKIKDLQREKFAIIVKY